MQLKEKKLVTEIKRIAKIGNAVATKISACQLVRLRQQIAKLQACLQQMSSVLDEIGVDVASQLSTSPNGRIDKRKRKTFKAPWTMDEALRVRASPLLSHIMDGASSPYVSRSNDFSGTQQGRGFARGIKEWGTCTKIQVKLDNKFQPAEDDGKKLKG
ncbi:hypothetical protein LOK49_Contig105G00003 [Camellia lanceoleosa]|nr:hypothetical protein LOK49_Contig105G00003 [Camellia lanceoleosa]